MSAETRDILVRDEGTLVLFYGESEAGSAWLEENIGHATRFGSGFVVEHRYAPDVAHGAQNDGLVLEGRR